MNKKPDKEEKETLDKCKAMLLEKKPIRDG